MKRRNKEINIFSMSALDLFASALGAFILIAVVLFPFFPNSTTSQPDSVLRPQLEETRRQLESCQMELQQTQESLEEARQDLQGAQQDLQQCNEQLRKKFLLVVISWKSVDDVDLHVTDPQGNEFYYREPRHARTPAKLEEDNTRGPGNEIWLHPEAIPGEYQIHYTLYNQLTSAVDVRGSILTPSGRETLPDVRLTRSGQKPLIAIVVIDDNGDATLWAQ